jgi:hypothetical protein
MKTEYKLKVLKVMCTYFKVNTFLCKCNKIGFINRILINSAYDDYIRKFQRAGLLDSLINKLDELNKKETKRLQNN